MAHNYLRGVVEKLCSPARWAEGPVWIAAQRSLIFSDVKGNRMFRWDAARGVTLFRAESDYANGNALDAQGRLITCEHGRRGLSCTEADGQRRLLVDRIEGHRFNSPNDVALHRDGSIWFSDPPYGIVGDEEGYHAESQVVGCYVYRFEPHSQRVMIAISDTQRPNGLAFSADGRWLYVVDMSQLDFPRQGRHEIRVYRLQGEEAHFSHVLAEVTPGLPDGLCVDGTGNLYCSCGEGVMVFSAQGETLGRIAIPERVSNCTFGGDDGDTLFVTATTSLYRVTFPSGAVAGPFI
ncbi:SMP-30/gluconolactonase/LRE family protein [Edwardsiella tarda]|uniref:SMP-30/gluconolactonase/LRE family protein n=1 Tax=Edwardsiella tarda TaxID=636 RepID=UPI003F6563DF